MKMNKEVKKKWIKALRSGDYEQGPSYLHRDNKFCCLGVLCELAVKDGIIPAPTYVPEVKMYQYDGSANYLPDTVKHWAGLSNKYGGNLTGPHDDGSEGSQPMSEWNDFDKATFEQLANMIEEQL